MIKQNKISLNRKFLYGVLIISIWVFVIPARSQVMEFDPVLVKYIQEALQNNPSLDALQHRINATEKHISQVRTWADPIVGLGLMNLPVSSFDFNQEPMTGVWLTVSQLIPLNAKPAIRGEIAELDLKSVEFNKRTLELKVVERIAHTWHNWAFLYEAVQTLGANIELLDNLIDVAKRKYETGKGNQHEILRAETRRTRMEEKRAGLEQRILTTGRRLAVLMGRKPDDAPDHPESLLDSFSILNPGELVLNLFKHNPSWLEAENAILISKKNTKLARRSLFPDLRLSTAYGFRQDTDYNVQRSDFISMTAGVTVPVFANRKQKAAIQEQIAIERAVISNKRAMELELELQLQQLLDKDTRLEDQIQLYIYGIELQATATLAAVISSYTVGKADFEALLMAETSLFNSRLERLSRIRERLNLRASIDALTGGRIFFSAKL